MKLLPLAFLAVSAFPVFAAPRIVTLSVPGMTCAACPITVKKAIAEVRGVASTEVDFDRRLARVTFDDAQTSVADLIRATANAGYPSTVASAR